MSKTRTAPGVGNAKGLAREPASLLSDCTTNPKVRQIHVYDLLSIGADNAVTAHTLAGWLGLTPRDVTRAIERERRAGVPILATCDRGRPGYFLPESDAEVESYLRSLTHREGEIRRTRLALAQTRQMRMDLDDGVMADA